MRERDKELGKEEKKFKDKLLGGNLGGDKADGDKNEDDPLKVEKIEFYTSTFRISKTTDLYTLKKDACDFWGLNMKNFKFFNEPGGKENTIIGDDPQSLTVDKHFEASRAKSSSG